MIGRKSWKGEKEAKAEGNGEKAQNLDRGMEPEENSGWWEIAGGKEDRGTLKNSHV